MRNTILSIGAIIILAFFSCEKEPIFLKDNGILPIVKLSIDEKYLWSQDSGLYIKENYYQKWEFPAKIEYHENGEQVFSEDIGFRIKGRGSRRKSMKSFGIYWREKYGNKNLQYPMFPDNQTSKFKRLLLRNSGDDFGKSHIKDGSISLIIKNIANVEYRDFKPCVLYLNNDYWGIYNIREMITPHHFEYLYGVDDDNVDLLEGSEIHPVPDDGTTEVFENEVIKFITENELSEQHNYYTLSNLIDVDSYIDYIIVNTYICNTDWPIGNAKWWRDKTSQNYTKWRWVVYDSDWSFDLKNLDKVWIGDLYGEPYDDERKEGFYIFNNLVKNEEFKRRFLTRYLFFIENVFEKERVENIINSNKLRIESEYENHQIKWDVIPKNKWVDLIDELIEFNNKRHDLMEDIIESL